MQGSFRLGRIAGIEVGVHYSWLFAFFLVSWSLAGGFFPARYQGWGAATYWTVGMVSALGLFASVLVHELSHSLVARARGRGVRGITLFVFGGVSTLEGEDKTPQGEFLVSVVGPLTSFALAVVFWAVVRLVGPGDSPGVAILAYLAVINLLLGAFNLLPGFPLDGGRVLRSAIWAATGSFQRATDVATLVGQGVGLIVVFFGLSQVFRGNVLGGLWVAFIGWFLNGAAEAVRQEHTLREGLRGIRVADVMNRDVPTVGPHTTVEELVLEHVLRRGQRALVVEDDGHVLGIVSITDAKEVPQAKWPTTPIAEIMTRPPLKTLPPDAPLVEALALLVDGAFNQIPVMEGTRALGLLTRADVVRVLQLRVTLGLRLPAAARAG